MLWPKTISLQIANYKRMSDAGLLDDIRLESRNMNLSTRQILMEIRGLIDTYTKASGQTANILHLPMDYAKYVKPILEEWPHLKVITGTQEKKGCDYVARHK